MRIATILLLCTCLAGTAYAQMKVPMGVPATRADGKVQVGYEGRGDYLKNEQIAKEKANPARYAKKNAATTPGTTPIAMANAPTAMPPVSPPSAPPAPPQAKGPDSEMLARIAQRQRQDSALRSDDSKPTPAATVQTDSAAPAPAATAAPAQQITQQSAPVGSPSNPPIFVGGRRVN